MHIDGKSWNILVLGEGQKQGLDNDTITAEAKYLINFKGPAKKISVKSAL